MTEKSEKSENSTDIKKCDFCTNPCGREWCVTKDDKDRKDQ